MSENFSKYSVLSIVEIVFTIVLKLSFKLITIESKPLFKKIEEPVFSKESGVYSVKKDVGAVTEYSSEVKYIVEKITKLFNTDFFDANTKQIRKLNYGDIAILCRSEKDEKAQIQ